MINDDNTEALVCLDLLENFTVDSCSQENVFLRPWGSYSILGEGANYKVKCLIVKPLQSLSLQLHYHRSENWIVVIGAAKVIVGDQELYLATNDSTYIPAGIRHRLENPGKVDLEVIEVQSGSYLGEDDIVRFSDIYGRA